MIVLSLFDGMSCGQIALKQLGIIPEVYYASEIDKHAVKQTQLNFPDTIQLGDVTRWNEWDIDWKSIDLLLAGSPCQGFSFAGKQLAFNDPRSKLFFVFIDILNHIRSYNPSVFFLLENVNMKRSHMRIISEYCGVFPVNINSNLVSAQNRNRWYWTNIRTKLIGLFNEIHSDIPQPDDRGIFLRDILESNVNEKYYLSKTNIEYLERVKNRGFIPKINPDKAGCLTIGNNSSKMSFDSGTSLISIEGKAPTQRSATGPSLDKKHNYQFICVAMRGREDNKQHIEPQLTGKTNCLTCVQKDNLILQCARENNTRGMFENKTPILFPCAGEQNNLLCRKEVIQLSPLTNSGGIQPYQQDRIYDVCGISPALLAGMSSNTHAIFTDRVRRLTPVECSRLQTIPSWYKWKCSDTQIYKMLGNGWTVDIIVHILSFMKEKLNINGSKRK